MRRRWQSMDRFVRVLLAIVVVALGVRLTYVAWGKGGSCPTETPGVVIPSECAGSDGKASDQVWYNSTANLVARGEGFTVPFGETAGMPAADHPPLTVFVLTPVSWIGERLPDSWLNDPSNTVLHRYTMALLGTVLVVLIALLGRRLGGDTAGLIAGGIAAIYPGLWVNDGLIMSESPANSFVVLSLLAALRFVQERTPKRALVLGLMTGIATLGRAELLLLAPLLLLAILGRSLFRLRSRETLRVVGATLGGLAIVLSPWVIYNNTRFREFTFVSTNDGLAMAASNCDPVFYGPSLGLTAYDAAPPDAPADIKDDGNWCIEDPEPGYPDADQSEVSSDYRVRALKYANNRLKRVPVVMLARAGRVWSLYRPADMITYNEGEGREDWASKLIMVGYYPVALAALIGSVVLVRRGKRRGRTVVAMLVVPCIIVTAAVALTYGQARFRAPAEPSLILLATLGMLMLRRPQRVGGFLQLEAVSPSDPS